jgi:drug/metabolite transporter (DMT)-like permease
MTSQRHSSTAHGGSVAAMIVPVPPAGPRHSTRDASGLLIRTAGSANVCYVLATRACLFGLAVVITSLYPGVTVLLARLLLGERMR